MNPRDLIAVKNEEKLLIIEGRKDAMLSLIASPYATSIKAGELTLLNSIMVETKGQNGIIAISAFSSGKHYGFFLEVLHEDDEGLPRVNLNYSWFPAHTLAQIERPDISVIIDGVRFSTEKDDFKKGGYRHVPDRALMARFVYAQADAEEVKASASEYVEEISAREQLKKLQGDYQRIFNKLEAANTEVASGKQSLAETRESLDLHVALLKRKDKEMAEMGEAFKDLRGFFITASGMLLAKVKLEGDDIKILTDLYDTIVLKHHHLLKVPEPTA